MLAEPQGTKPVTEKKKSTGGNGVVSSLFNRSVLTICVKHSSLFLSDPPSPKTLEEYSKRVQAFANWLSREGKGTNLQAELRARLFQMPEDSSDSETEDRLSKRTRKA